MSKMEKILLKFYKSDIEALINSLLFVKKKKISKIEMIKIAKIFDFIRKLEGTKYHKYQIQNLKKIINNIIICEIPELEIRERKIIYLEDITHKTHDLPDIFSGHWENLFATAYNMIHENSF